VGRPRGVIHSVARLELSDGDWIEVRRALTVGEERDLVALAVRGFRPDGTAELDTKKLWFLAAATYLVGWSLADVNTGLPIPWITSASIEKRVDVLRALDADTMREIDEAITKHREGLAADPNTSGGGSGSGQTSPSAAA